jgi:hypothetical protein
MDMGMLSTSEIWASEDIKIPYRDLYEKLSSANMAQQPGMKAAMQAMPEGLGERRMPGKQKQK